MAVAAPVATAQTGSSGGGMVFVAKPVIAKVSCLRRCASRKRAQAGSTLKIAGESLGSVRTVLFQGSYGKGDDVAVKVRAGSDTRVLVRVPIGAVSGQLSVSTGDDVSSAPTKAIPILPPPPPEPNTELSPVPGPRDAGAPMIETGTSRTKAYVGAHHAVTFSYRISQSAPTSVTVELVRASDGTAVKTWSPPAAAAGAVQSVSWSGALGHSTASPGRYSFRLTAAGSNGAVARSSQGTDVQRDAFDLYDHIFPVRGKHNFGGAGAHFGAGRAGHSHQGQDTFARCGTPLVAARGGKVKYKAYHSAAGYYMVIDGAGTDVDYVYMHMEEPSAFQPGDRVYTGQRIGSVGDTGNARGCHLHFEMWSAPGWYDGGKPFDPLPSLTAWDSWS
jgi:murein DD-endopeptidase MepM/ murein hydrolase activator NlpD